MSDEPYDPYLNDDGANDSLEDALNEQARLKEEKELRTESKWEEEAKRNQQNEHAVPEYILPGVDEEKARKMNTYHHKQDDFEYVKEVLKGSGKILMGCLGISKVLLEGKGERERSGFTTSGDVYSLNHIVRNLTERFPQDGIIAEGLDEKDFIKLLNFEIELKNGIHPSKSGFYWVVDPLCGTIMHERGVLDFIISAALVDDNAKIYFGCIYDPGHKEMFYAMNGQGAYLEAENKIIPIRVSDVNGDNLKKQALVSIEQGIVRKESEVTKIAGKIKRMRTAGTCGLELSYVGAGRLDAVLKGGQPLYDYAGGIIIVEEAGGIVTDFDGNPINKRLNYDKCTDILASNSKVHEQLLEYTRLFERKKAT